MIAKRFIQVGSLALLAGAAAPACATKHDVRDLQAQLVAMQARNDSLYRQLQRQNREVLDSVHGTAELLVRVRGDLGHQLLGLEQQLVQVQELTGQSGRRLQELNAQLEQNRQNLATPTPTDTTGGAAAAANPSPDSGGSPAELYALARTQLQNGAASTARMAFQQLLRSFPEDTLAPAAQLGLAETYVRDDPDRSVREFSRVVELYPSSSRAPAALLRAATVQSDRGTVTSAREYLQRILARYPASPEASQARRRLDSLKARSSTSAKKSPASRKRRR
ncbi:MAG TPA: tetratricopeptide repeat protein [Longimicrobiales bacterium]